MITEFTGEYRFLSNFWAAPIRWQHPGLGTAPVWETNEHAFQAAKTNQATEVTAIWRARTSAEAKRLGRTVCLREGWDAQRKRVMLDLQLAKFTQHPDLLVQLAATGTAELIEGNHWHDNYWGRCSCRACQNSKGQRVSMAYRQELFGTSMAYCGDGHPGHNYLGKILMAVRDVLRED